LRICLLSLGCKVNQAEIIEMERALSANGHELVGLDARPEVCVVNTCSVTARSDSQSRQLIRRAGRLGARIIVTGCYAELNKEEAASIDGVERVVNNANKSHIINILNGNSKCSTLYKAESRTRRILKIQDGCDFECSYCIVWKARGRSRSLSRRKVVEQVEKAVLDGVEEVILTGVHLGLYGRDCKPDDSVSGLVEELFQKTRIKRLRLSSLEINEIDDRLLDLMDDGRLCRHLHIPLQSGDDGVLRLMRRGYDALFFMRRVDQIARRIPGIAIGTDVIAGFPVESEEAFSRTCEVVRSMPFSYVHVFRYSRRPGTVASRMGVEDEGHSRGNGASKTGQSIKGIGQSEKEAISGKTNRHDS